MDAPDDGNEYHVCVKAAINKCFTVPSNKMTIISLCRLIEPRAATRQSFSRYKFLSLKACCPN